MSKIIKFPFAIVIVRSTDVELGYLGNIVDFRGFKMADSGIRVPSFAEGYLGFKMADSMIRVPSFAEGYLVTSHGGYCYHEDKLPNHRNTIKGFSAAHFV